MNFAKSCLFRRMLIIYALIFIIPVLILFNMFSFINTKSKNDNMVLECQSKAKTISEMVDNELFDFYNLANRISYLDWFIRVQSNSEVIYKEYGISLLKQNEIKNQLAIFQTAINVNSTIGILLKDKHIIISPAFWGNEEFYFSIQLPLKKNEREIFLSELQKEEKFALINCNNLGIKTGENIILMSSDLYVSNSPKAVLFMPIKEQFLSEYIEKVSSSDVLSFQILKKDSLIYSYNKDDKSEIKNKHIYTTEIPSSWNNVKYVIAVKHIPVSFINVLTKHLLVSIFIIFIGIALGYILAVASYKPVQKLIKRMSGEIVKSKQRTNNRQGRKKFFNSIIDKIFMKVEEYATIEHFFDILEKEKKELKDISEQYYNMIRNNLLQNLLLGYFEDNKVKTQLAKFNIPYTNEDSFLVSIVYTDDEKEESAFDLYLHIKTYFMGRNKNLELLRINNGNLVLIFNFRSKENVDGSVDLLNDLSKNIADSLNINIKIVCGSVGKGIIGISKSYQSTMEENRSSLYYSVTSEYINGYYYPFDWEIQLINSLKAGNKDITIKILNEIKLENISRNLSQYQKIKLFYLVFESFANVMIKFDIDVNSVEIQFEELIINCDEDKQWDSLISIASKICNSVLKLPGNHSSMNIKKEILEYIEDNYQWSGLSLEAIADVFNYSVSRISRIVKQTVKINFVDYLQLLRVNKAKEYFRNGNYDLMAVGRKVGFENESTFRRTFLKHEGVTPSEYVRQCKILIEDGICLSNNKTCLQ